MDVMLLNIVNRILYKMDKMEWHGLSCQESVAGGFKARKSTLECTKRGEFLT